MISLPTKPIESATIHYAGEPEAGVADQTFELTAFIDPTCYTADELKLKLADTRRAISRFYSDMLGDTPSWVQFDYEIEARDVEESESP